MSNFLRGLVASLAIIVISPSLHAQTHIAKSNVFVSSHSNGYWEYLPANYNSTSTKYPVIIYIHGGASYGNGSNSALQLLLSNEGVPYYINQGQFPATFPLGAGTTSFIVISPQFTLEPGPVETNQVITFVLNNYRVDLQRVYVTGYSVGGDAAWKAPSSLVNANRMAALAPVAGYNNPYFDTTAKYIAGSNLPVWAIHSNVDQTIPVATSQNMVNKINSFSPAIPAILTMPNGVSHDNTVRVAYDPTYRPNGKNMYEWFLQYSKNYPPIANAGVDFNITLPTSSATLTGSGSSDPENTALTYLWSKVSGPSQFSISNINIANPGVSNLVAGVYKFRLQVTDVGGLSSADTMQLTVINPNPNQMPVAVAGNDQSIVFPQTTVSLSGTNSFDPDGIVESCTWSKIAGPTSFNITNPAATNTTVTNLRPGVYKFELTATDNEGGVGKDTVIITLTNPNPNIPPVADAGSDQAITLPVNSVNLSGSASTDADGIISSYQWTQVPGGPSTATLGTPNAVNTTAGNLAVGTYKFELKVTDDSSAVKRDTVQVTVLSNGTPIPATIEAEAYNTMLGVGIYPATDVGGGSCVGSIDNGDWFEFNIYATVGATYTIQFRVATPNSGQQFQFRKGTTVLGTVAVPNTGGWQNWTTITTTLALPVGSQTLRIYSTSNGWNANWISFAVSGSNQSPTANAGTNQLITLPTNTTTLTGSGNDPDGNIASYAWTQVGGTAATIATPSSSSTIINGLTTSGARTFRLTVTDNLGATGTSDIVVTVNAPPTANAGTNQSITLPTSTASLTGSGNDPDGNIASYLWTQTAGTTATIESPSLASTNISGLTTTGTRTFRLTVTDNSGATGFSTVNVNVIGNNIPPTASAGNNQSITLPTSSATLTGSGNDPDGNITGYAWTQIGTGSANIQSPSSSTTLITGMTTPGTRTFRLTVTDNSGSTGTSDVTVTVIPGDAPPFVSTNNAQTVIAPNVSFTSTSTSSSGIALTKWTKFSVPGQSMKRLTVIGSSTSAGYAATSADSSYVGKLNAYYKSQGIVDTIYNLSVSGAVIFDANITYALDRGAPVLLVNYPSNGYTGTTYTITQICNKYQEIADSCTLRGVQFYTTGTQPRNDYSPADRQRLVVINDSLRLRFGARFIDFLTPVINPVDNGYKPIYDAGDAIHTNNAGHEVFYQLVKAANIFQNTISSSAIITTPNNANTTVTSLAQGMQRFQVSVLDNSGLAASAVAQVTYNPANPPNQPPIARAGADQSINLPVTSVTLDGTASTDEHNIIGYLWTKIPGGTGTGGSITSPTSSTTTFTGLSAGTYRVELRVTDDSSSTAKDTVIITVNAAKPIPGHIEAETQDNSAGVGIYPATDVGGGSCLGSIDNGDWFEYNVFVQSSGTYFVNFRIATPNNGCSLQMRKGTTVLLNRTIPNTGGWQTWNTISSTVALVPGLQTLRIYSSGGSWNMNWIDFSLSAATNNPPVANAGVDQTIQSPASSVSLDGTASTDDHSIVSYLWTRIGGNGPGGTLNTPNSALTTFTGLSVGTYTVELAVVDDSSVITRDTVLVTVNPPPAGLTIPGHIEGESYNASTGVGLYPTTDVGGGQCVGSIDNGDWFEYNVTVTTTGTYTVNIRVATIFSGQQLQIRRGTTVLATIAVPLTNGWQTWVTATGTVSLTAGAQTLRIWSTSSSWNLNWIDFISGTSRGEAPITDEMTIPQKPDYIEPLPLVIYPNPVKDQFAVQINNEYAGKAKLQIIDEGGNLKKEVAFEKIKGFTQLSVSTEGLAKGIYFIRVQTGSITKTISLVKQ